MNTMPSKYLGIVVGIVVGLKTRMRLQEAAGQVRQGDDVARQEFIRQLTAKLKELQLQLLQLQLKRFKKRYPERRSRGNRDTVYFSHTHSASPVLAECLAFMR